MSARFNFDTTRVIAIVHNSNENIIVVLKSDTGALTKGFRVDNVGLEYMIKEFIMDDNDR